MQLHVPLGLQIKKKKKIKLISDKVPCFLLTRAKMLHTIMFYDTAILNDCYCKGKKLKLGSPHPRKSTFSTNNTNKCIHKCMK